MNIKLLFLATITLLNFSMYAVGQLEPESTLTAFDVKNAVEEGIKKGVEKAMQKSWFDVMTEKKVVIPVLGITAYIAWHYFAWATPKDLNQATSEVKGHLAERQQKLQQMSSDQLTQASSSVNQLGADIRNQKDAVASVHGTIQADSNRTAAALKNITGTIVAQTDLFKRAREKDATGTLISDFCVHSAQEVSKVDTAFSALRAAGQEQHHQLTSALEEAGRTGANNLDNFSTEQQALLKKLGTNIKSTHGMLGTLDGSVNNLSKRVHTALAKLDQFNKNAQGNDERTAQLKAKFSGITTLLSTVQQNQAQLTSKLQTAEQLAITHGLSQGSDVMTDTEESGRRSPRGGLLSILDRRQ